MGGLVGDLTYFSYCENYYSKDRTKTLRINIDKALNQLQTGVDAAIVSSR